MMTKKKSPKGLMLKALITLPVLAAAVYGFANLRSVDNSMVYTTTGSDANESNLVYYFHLPDYAPDGMYEVYLPDGVLVELGGQLHLEQVWNYGFDCKDGEPKMMLDGKQFDRTCLPENVKCSALKKMKVDYDGERLVVNLITTDVEIPDTVKSNLPTRIDLTVRQDGTMMIQDDYAPAEFGSMSNINAARRAIRRSHGQCLFWKDRKKPVANLNVMEGAPESAVKIATNHLRNLGIQKINMKEVKHL